jgi:hypothetical protein
MHCRQNTQFSRQKRITFSVPNPAAYFESTIKFRPGKLSVNCLQLAGYSIFQPDRMRRHASGSCDAALNLTESTLSGTSNGSRMVPNKMKNVLQRPTAVKYSVVIRVFNETL